MRILSIIIVTILLSSYHASFAQDPGTLIDVKLMNDTFEIGQKDFHNYSILFRKSWINKDDSLRNYLKPIEYKSYGNYQYGFNIFYWEGYLNETLELTIIHLHDTMTVRIRDTNKYYIWNAHFYFKIPFKKGYFEITKLVHRNDIKDTEGMPDGYAIPNNYKWEAVAKDKRKLLMDDR